MQNLIGNIFIYGVLSLLFLALSMLMFSTIQSLKFYTTLAKYKGTQQTIDLIVGFALGFIYIIFFYMNTFLQSSDNSYKFNIIISLIVFLPMLIYIKPYAGIG
jgi:hypothetical protein